MTTKSEEVAEFINCYMWAFHAGWFSCFGVRGIEFLCNI